SLTGKNFLTTCRGIDVAMQSVLNLCREKKKGKMDTPKSSSICRALAFRYALLSGILLREGGRTASLRFWGRALQCASAACGSKVPRSLRLPLAFFRAYTARGGRGAWRLARLFVTR
ncbi:MAG: hypothetical protein SPE13_04990, partial [Alloprevotella sp.]|nr:hypothetical protein [Alloprevotella sp.]